MLVTFVVGLREGIEASLIVGIVAAFLVRQGRSDALRSMWLGVGAALALCAAFGIGVAAFDRTLPQAGQEALESVVIAIAVAAITYMIVWMRRNSRGLRRELEGKAAAALTQGSTLGLVGVAFLAVLREGFETVVFVLAVFQTSTDPAGARLGVVLGLAAAVAVGYGIYRGGVKIDIGRFFRATSVVLVVVAAGLVASGLHSAHEAGWLDAGQAQALDLRGLVPPGSVAAALVAAVLGIQPQPTVAETIGWLLYAVPLLGYVLASPVTRPRTTALKGTP